MAFANTKAIFAKSTKNALFAKSRSLFARLCKKRLQNWPTVNFWNRLFCPFLGKNGAFLAHFAQNGQNPDLRGRTTSDLVGPCRRPIRAKSGKNPKIFARLLKSLQRPPKLVELPTVASSRPFWPQTRPQPQRDNYAEKNLRSRQTGQTQWPFSENFQKIFKNENF